MSGELPPCSWLLISSEIYNFMFGELRKSEPQIAFEPTTLRDLVGCSNH